MVQNLISQKLLSQAFDLIIKARRVVITCHMTPDGDAIGSSLCAWHLLRAMGKQTAVVTPDCIPSTLNFLPGAGNAVAASVQRDYASRLMSGADLILCLDFNELRRVDRLAPIIEASGAKRIVIDHHLNPDIKADVVISHPEVSSTCALLYSFILQTGLEEYVDTAAATCCCAGMMTDTGNFSYNSLDPRLYLILARLIEKGVDKDELYRRLFNTNSLRRLRIMAYAQFRKMHVMPEHHCAIITLSLAELKEFDYHRGDTESLVNVPLSIPGIIYSIYLREDAENYVKVSMRSRGDFSVRELCERYFGGGGHHNASGGEVSDSLDAALQKVLEIIPECDRMIAESETE